MSNEADGFVLAVIATVTGYGLWRNGMKLRSLSSNTATSKVASAAKGFVELSGIARALNSEVLRDPIAHKPCVWYHFETEERKRWGKKSDWRVINSATSANARSRSSPICKGRRSGSAISMRRPRSV